MTECCIPTPALLQPGRPSPLPSRPRFCYGEGPEAEGHGQAGLRTRREPQPRPQEGRTHSNGEGSVPAEPEVGAEQQPRTLEERSPPPGGVPMAGQHRGCQGLSPELQRRTGSECPPPWA